MEGKLSLTKPPGTRTRMPRIQPFVVATVLVKCPDWLVSHVTQQGLILDEDGEGGFETHIPLRVLFDLFTQPSTKPLSLEAGSSDEDSSPKQEGLQGSESDGTPSSELSEEQERAPKRKREEKEEAMDLDK